MSRIKVIGDTITFRGDVVATINPKVTHSVREDFVDAITERPKPDPEPAGLSMEEDTQ